MRILRNQKSKIENLKSCGGFTLMEVIVVIFIISLALVGVLSLVIQNIQVEYVNRNALVASQLAQEGLELVRNKRDNNWLTPGNDWRLGAGAGTDSDFLQDGTYALDYTETIYGATDINDPTAFLKLDSNGFYTNNPAAASSTPFSRLITVTADTASSSSVSCLVRWRERGNVYNYVADTILYDWR